MQMQNKLNEFKKCFRNDVMQLLQSFNQKDTFRYEDFVELWNEMKFYHLFTLFYFYPVYYRDFIKESIKIVLEFLCEDLNLEVKTASLYLLYAIYFHQKDKPKLKISVTPVKWLQILKFIGSVSEDQHFDIEYVFRYLLHSDAFEFCAIGELKGLTTKNLTTQKLKPSIEEEENKINTARNLNVISRLEFENNVLNDKLMSDMETIHEAYMQMKIEFSGPNAKAPMKSLNLITQDFEKLTKLESMEPIEDEDEETNIYETTMTSPEKESLEKTSKTETVLERRRRVREKAAKGALSQPAAEMSYTEVAPSTSKSAMNDSTLPKSKTKKKTKKTRYSTLDILATDDEDEDEMILDE